MDIFHGYSSRFAFYSISNLLIGRILICFHFVGGDNLLVGTYDRKMLWFDLDLSTKPYKTLRLHRNAVRAVAFHKRYPLFASCSDDRSTIISHGMVYK